MDTIENIEKLYNSNKSSKIQEKSCPSCGATKENFIIESGEGAQICNRCGTHVSDILISMKQEWTNGSESSMERCSTITDKLLENQSKSTWISNVSANMRLNHMIHNVYQQREPKLYSMYSLVDKIGEKYNISKAVRELAKEYCKLISTENIKRGNTRRGIIGAAIAQAAKQKNNIGYEEHTLAKMMGIEKEYVRAGTDQMAKFLFKYYEDISYIKPRSIVSYANDYMNKLDVDDVMRDEVIKLINVIQPSIIHIKNTPSSIAGSCIYYVYNMHYGDNTDKMSKFKKLMTNECSLHDMTIKNCYKNIVNLLEKINNDNNE